MMQPEIAQSRDRKYNVIISVDDGLSLTVDLEQGEQPSLLDLQEVLLLMSLQIRSQLNEGY